ncbi:PorP/SprF family type IX secretion system membrane protein [Pontibacter akesuensis]|uniref:Type IX secretion system membrane protein, PorP/SprF family n=1 Tax=Pontibacter akesuensis TaxID=388950 RepID=A0A1I7HQ57_9BACT|nr:type IX secretion system membrane protein PorP/SprF [Pontibacter akesuensis]GHA63043.1 membrane protein [Pontibacter akesuensis]SFU62894.1 type IX secretion system membrane protein, PorP/SprF family [Pontibacter akesuensis]
MKMRICYLLLALLLTTAASAQQNPQYSQYIFNSMAINPAYAGSKNVLNLNAFHRSQWTGIEGAPTTQSLLVDGILANQRLGLGLGLTRDEIGAQTTSSIYANFAVKLPLSENAVISLGLAPGVVQTTLDGSKFGITEDPSIPTGKETVIKPDVKIGAYLHTNRFYAGVSAADLLQFDDMQQVEPERHYYFTTGYLFDVTPFVKLKPSVLIKEDFNAPSNVDLNAFVLLGERLWLGSSYRTSLNLFNEPETADVTKRTAVAFIGEVQVLKQLRVGYSYDKMLNGYSNQSTHEVSVGYYFFQKKETKMLTPQYF